MFYKSFRICAYITIALVCYVLLPDIKRANQHITLPRVDYEELKSINSKLAYSVANDKVNPNLILLRIRNNEFELLAISQVYDSARIKTIEKFLHKVKMHAQMPNGDYVWGIGDALRKTDFPPALAFASNLEYVESSKIILCPDSDAMHGYTQTFKVLQQAMHDYAWDKKKPVIFWRGAATGHTPKNSDELIFSRRTLVDLTKKLHFLDAHFTSHANLEKFQPDLMQQYSLSEHVSPTDAIQYRYLIDVDGNSCSYSRMAWTLFANSTLFKHQSNQVQWYYDKLLPWVHYIPIAHDFSDLETNYIWAEQHPQQAYKISNNGHEFAINEFSDEAIRQAFVDALYKYNAALTNLSSNREDIE